MSGTGLHDHKTRLECETVDESEVSSSSPVITVDPFVPCNDKADTFDAFSFPTFTITFLLSSDDTKLFFEDKARAEQIIEDDWPDVRRAMHYYLHHNWEKLEDICRTKFDFDVVDTTAHARTTAAHTVVGSLTTLIVGKSGKFEHKLYQTFAEKHLAALDDSKYREFALASSTHVSELERDVFEHTRLLIDRYETWSIGRLARLIQHTETDVTLDQLTLFRDEFDKTRDLYQQGFELACKCLWILLAAHNVAEGRLPEKNGNTSAGVKMNNLNQFKRAPNAEKISVISEIEGWREIKRLLNNKRRNSIGHASARHDLQTGRIVSDRDSKGITYIAFLNEIFGTFEMISFLLKCLRNLRVLGSPDF